ncbi:hypothetical protein AAFF_G00098950 [Aldrovandia affinis]|uniref:Uncharacterized protein n=1 Tax=Aldrovandia affinis TaxID=143900 RepID=A0AAD7WBY7_9TELE|nr:hypothetical protein AAFF_G00098950 [Aldrovandia affinis]
MACKGVGVRAGEGRVCWGGFGRGGQVSVPNGCTETSLILPGSPGPPRARPPCPIKTETDVRRQALHGRSGGRRVPAMAAGQELSPSQVRVTGVVRFGDGEDKLFHSGVVTEMVCQCQCVT